MLFHRYCASTCGGSARHFPRRRRHPPAFSLHEVIHTHEKAGCPIHTRLHRGWVGSPWRGGISRIPRQDVRLQHNHRPFARRHKPGTPRLQPQVSYRLRRRRTPLCRRPRGPRRACLLGWEIGAKSEVRSPKDKATELPSSAPPPMPDPLTPPVQLTQSNTSSPAPRRAFVFNARPCRRDA
jgi:hypothetical protein